MDTCKSQDKAILNPLAAATDEALVTAAKLGNRPAFAELWERHSIWRSKWLVESRETETMQKT
jgi:hypothetical protein